VDDDRTPPPVPRIYDGRSSQGDRAGMCGPVPHPFFFVFHSHMTVIFGSSWCNKPTGQPMGQGMRPTSTPPPPTSSLLSFLCFVLFCLCCVVLCCVVLCFVLFCFVHSSVLCRILLKFQSSKEAWQVIPHLFNSTVGRFGCAFYLMLAGWLAGWLAGCLAYCSALRFLLVVSPCLPAGHGGAVLWRPHHLHQDTDGVVRGENVHPDCTLLNHCLLLFLPSPLREQLNEEEKNSVRGVILQLLQHLLKQAHGCANQSVSRFCGDGCYLTCCSTILGPSSRALSNGSCVVSHRYVRAITC